jgi:lipoprotein-anchoring transpeptidase ErfK/SrfK
MKLGAQIPRTKQALSRVSPVLVMALVAVAQVAGQDTVAGSVTARGNRRIIISVPDRKLALIQDGRVLRVYPVAVGTRVSPSPTGEFTVANRLSKPTYYHPGVVIPPGKRNPLGTRWIGLDRKGYGIHGTNQPQSIGMATSHGCIRMAKADLEQLFDAVQVGDPVEIRARADAETASIFGSGTHTTTTAGPSGIGSLGWRTDVIGRREPWNACS